MSVRMMFRFKGDRFARRQRHVVEPTGELRDAYRPMRGVQGEVVGWVCWECGRLAEAPHLDRCSIRERFGIEEPPVVDRGAQAGGGE